MPSDLFRDSSIGQLVNYLSKGRLLPYADQLSTYEIPARYLPSSTLNSASATLCGTPGVKSGTTTPLSPVLPRTPSSENANAKSEVTTLVDAEGVVKPTLSSGGEKEGIENQLEKGDLKLKKLEGKEEQEVVFEPYLVDWDGPLDPDNPRNWTRNKRVFVGFLISLLTFTIYIASACYTSSIPGLIEEFNISLVTATWGLTLFVLAYGMGPMFLAPLQEMALIGRSPIYIIGLLLFVIFQVPPIFAKNIGTILVFRFFAGFVGSPALATGGASMGDIFPESALPYAIGLWSMGAVMGPVLGPVVGNFAAEANGWRWPFWELLWLSGFSLIVLSFTLPETLGETILLRRAERLRKLTGNNLLKTRSELDAVPGETVVQVATENFIRAFVLSVEPAIFFANLYIAFVYAVFYCWFEAFPLTFTGVYGFSLGVAGLPYLGFFVSGVITFIGYVFYNKYHMEPRRLNDPNFQPEARLELAVFAACLIPISLLMFGWGARADVPWIVSVIGAALYLPGIYLIFQQILIYITSGYPKHAASLLAGNDLFRSTIASFFPLFGGDLFTKLGLGGGSSLLAGISIILIPVLWVLMKYGGRLRARSKYTDHHL